MKHSLRLAIVAGTVGISACAAFKTVFEAQPQLATRVTRGTVPPNGGVWEGSWTNKVTGATGTARITAMGYTGMVYASYEIQGDIFGCGEPSLQGTILLNQGTDFTKKGIKVTQSDLGLGDFSLTSKKGKTKGGATGSCGGKGPAWDTKTKAKKNIVAGKVFLTGNGADHERTTFRLRRCVGTCQSPG